MREIMGTRKVMGMKEIREIELKGGFALRKTHSQVKQQNCTWHDMYLIRDLYLQHYKTTLQM
jgi:hypothetical protein